MKHTLLLALLLSLLVVTGTSAQKLKTVQNIEGIPPSVEYRAITHDPVGNIYVATSIDVFMIPTNSYRAQPMKIGSNIMDVDYSYDHGLIMLTREGIVRFIATGKELTLDAGGGATCMDVTRNVIWVGTENGVHTISIAKEEPIDHFTTEDGILLSNHINFIHTDPNNVRWIGTQLGVVRIEEGKWKLYEKEQPVTAITSTSEGAWLAADDMMYLVNSFNRWFEIDAWRDLVSGHVKALAADKQGMLFIASEKLVKYNPYEEKIISMNEGGINEQMILLDQGPGNNVWMAGHNGMSRVLEDTTAIVLEAPKGNDIVAALEVRSLPVCDGMTTGHLAAIVRGGTEPYKYAWSHNQVNSAEATKLAPGLYQVTISDQNGRSTVASGIIPASTPITVAPRVDSKATDALAKDALATAVVKGGVTPYQFLWSNGETAVQALELNEGSHTIRVIDANGCIATGNVKVEADKVLKSLDINTLTLGQTIRLDKLYFDADSATIKPASYAVMQEIYDFLSSNDKVTIEIGGHTNSLPEDEYCDRLSTARAKNIAEFLYEKGIPESQIAYKGYGKRQPIASNQTVEGRRRNQRVEIKIIAM
jgi:outer membrane protein OmpA-like peptidoglycan-associated protein/ligand-binding sensor domain-containing protein